MPKKKTPIKGPKSASKKAAPKNLSLKSKISKPEVRLKNPKKALVVSVIIFVIVVIAAWWQFIFADPSRVLSDMLAGNLRTPGVTKEVHQTGGPSQITQSTYLSFIDGPKTQSLTVLEQAMPGGPTNKVATENIGTPDEDFLRYRSIDVSSGGQPANTSEAVNVWASRSGGEGGQHASFLTEGIFGIVAFANFDKNQAGALLQTINESGLYKYASVEKKFEDGRLVYKYQMQLQPVALINYLAHYSALLGVDHHGQLDAKNYAGAQPVQVALTVDVLSRQLRSIEYTDSGRVENYSGYGLTRNIEVPTETISITELQRRLQLAQ